jgi:hypothetical protein
MDLVYFKCPFCCKIIDAVERSLCKHVVYDYETVNYETIIMNDAFFKILLKLISSDPHRYIEDFDFYLEDNLVEIDNKNGETIQIDLDKLETILEDKISPDVLEDLIKANGIPITMKSLIEYSVVDVCMGDTYYYIISDDDLDLSYKSQYDDIFNL